VPEMRTFGHMERSTSPTSRCSLTRFNLQEEIATRTGMPRLYEIRLQALPPWTLLRGAADQLEATMARKCIDCREFPNEANCTLEISVTEQGSARRSRNARCERPRSRGRARGAGESAEDLQWHRAFQELKVTKAHHRSMRLSNQRTRSDAHTIAFNIQE